MKEYKPPQKSLLYYCGVVLLVMLLLNAFVFPQLFTARVEEVQYGEFLQMVDEGRVSQVEVDEHEIVFADTATPTGYYKTGRMEDPGLARQLYEAGITQYGTPIVQQVSPLASMLISWVLPLLLFMLLGRVLMNSLAKRAGGGAGNFMSFGKSNAKVYVQSTDGIRFADVAGEDEAKELLTEIVDFLHNPKNTPRSAPASPAARCW